MKTDFLTRFKGRTSALNKREGVTGIIKANSNPIDKTPQHLSFSSYFAKIHENQFSDLDKRPSYSHDVTPTNNYPQIYTNIEAFPRRKLSQASPLKQNTAKSHFVPQKSSLVNMEDFEFVAIPKRWLQYGITMKDGGQSREAGNNPVSRQFQSKSASVEMPANFKGNMAASEVFSNGSYQRQNEKKRSFVLAAINSMKPQ